MKNIHILPTDQPSRLVQGKNFYFYKDGIDIIFLDEDEKFQNICITSDEEIKDGDWMIRGNEQPTLVTPNFFWDFGVRYYKIILTTDPTLIADGVQAIDDEFLKWFVKNPSCDGVEVESMVNMIQFTPREFIYKIIIPQEEPKQEGYICPHTKIQCDDECCVSAEDCHITSSLASGTVDCEEQKQHLINMMQDDEELGLYEEPKRETLEEAAGNLADPNLCKTDNWIAGAKWQAERMYSEQEVKPLIDFIKDCASNWDCDEDSHRYNTPCRMCEAQKVLEQFKKK